MNTSGDKTQEIGRDLMQANYRDQQRLSSSKKGRPLAFYPPNRFWGRWHWQHQRSAGTRDVWGDTVQTVHICTCVVVVLQKSRLLHCTIRLPKCFLWKCINAHFLCKKSFYLEWALLVHLWTIKLCEWPLSHWDWFYIYIILWLTMVLSPWLIFGFFFWLI